MTSRGAAKAHQSKCEIGGKMFLYYGTARALIAQYSKVRWRRSPARGEVYSFDVGGRKCTY
jgi:hypothetical protein